MLGLAESLSFLDSPNIDWKSIAITALIGKYVFECYIGYRQYQVLSRSCQSNPDKFNIEVVQELDQSQARIRFAFARATTDLVKEIFLIKLDILSKLWVMAGSVNHSLSNASLIGHFIGESARSQCVLFFATFGAMSAVEVFPWAFYESFYLNKHLEILPWLIPLVFMYVGEMIIKFPHIYVLCRLVDHFGTSFAPYMCVISFVFEAFFIPYMRQFVVSLLVDIDSLPEGELKMEIETVAKRIDIPLADISIVDYPSDSFTVDFIGFPWKSKTVINSILIEKYATQEVVSAFVRDAYSLKQNKKWKNQIVGQMGYLLAYASFSKFLGNKSFASSFGFAGIHSTYFRYFLFSFVYAPVEFATRFITLAMSRKLEFDADAFVKQHGYAADYAAYLKKSTPKHSTCNIPDWLFAVFNMPSPSVAERLKALGLTCDEKNEERSDNNREQ